MGHRQLAIGALIVGTNVSSDLGVFGKVSQVPGVVVPAIQVWPSGRGYLETGVGVGVLED